MDSNVSFQTLTLTAPFIIGQFVACVTCTVVPTLRVVTGVETVAVETVAFVYI